MRLNSTDPLIDTAALARWGSLPEAVSRFNGLEASRQTVETVGRYACPAQHRAKAAKSMKELLASELPGPTRMFHAYLPGAICRRLIAQVFNLLYRRLVVGRASSTFPGPAGCKPAIQQSETLRYALRPSKTCEASEPAARHVVGNPRCIRRLLETQTHLP